MSHKQYLPHSKEEGNAPETGRLEPRAGLRVHRPSPRWSAHRRRDAWLLLGVLLFGIATIFTLSSGDTLLGKRANVTQPGTSPAPTSQGEPSTPPVSATTDKFREYLLQQTDSQVMRLTVDHSGRVWFGEMGRNYLAVFDPRTQTFQQMTPPHGRFGMMGIQVASDDTIWFAEQYANYIGHYFPRTGRFQLYPLPVYTVPDPSNAGKTLTLPSAPNDLALDAHGDVWFTEFNVDRLGRLDPRTGHMQQYPLTAKQSVEKLAPYGVAVDPEGNVWFTESSNDHIGRLDPSTGHIRLFAPPGPPIAPMEIASDAHGAIWVTSFSSGLLLQLNPRTGAVTSYYASLSGEDTGGLYGLAVTSSGNVWVTILAENALARLDAATHRFVYYRVPTENSGPLALVVGADQTLWFTETDKIGMLRP